MISEAMVTAAWRAAPAGVRELLDPDEVRRILAAALAERRADEVRVFTPIPQRPDAEGDW